jgi:hypothetical protein
MDAAAVGRTQKEDRERGIDQQDIFHRVVLFLAAITLRLLSRVLEADDTPFGARRVKKPKPISFLAFLDPPTSAPGLDFPTSDAPYSLAKEATGAKVEPYGLEIIIGLYDGIGGSATAVMQRIPGDRKPDSAPADHGPSAVK